MGWDDLVKGGLNLIGGLVSHNNQSSTGDAITDIIRQREIDKYNQTKAYNDAAQKYNTEIYGPYAAASAAASRRNASARAAAAAQTEANRQKALKKAQHFLQGKYKETMAMYEPFKQSATDLLPQMQQSYTSGMNLSNSLMGLLQQPENMAMLKQTPTASMLGPKLPDFLKGG